MSNPALTTLAWDPLTELEPNVIGDELAAEIAGQEDSYGEGLRYWHEGHQLDTLAGTATPGDIHFDLRAFDAGPWWDRELLNIDISGPPYESVGRMVHAIFGDEGLSKPPPEIPTAQLYTLDEINELAARFGLDLRGEEQ
jgi:hypothetical protein